MAVRGRLLRKNFLCCTSLWKSDINMPVQKFLRKHFNTWGRCHSKANFGLLFDIDGVIVRERKVLPTAKEAFKKLIDGHGRFRVPTVFVTNAGNALRQNKAEQLSEWLDVEVSNDQVVMAHSPLRLYNRYFDKQVLVIGQGPVKEIAEGIGYHRDKIMTVDELREVFPHYDMVDHNRRRFRPCPKKQKNFKRIEVILWIGEPSSFESVVQLVYDALVTNGQMVPGSTRVTEIPYPHIPVLACNMDLMWMASAPMPRWGNGLFLLLMEQAYLKGTGRELKYSALVGKPSLDTYLFADEILREQAVKLGVDSLDTIYCVGDNPQTDIYGANFYNRFLQRRSYEMSEKQAVMNGGGSVLAAPKDYGGHFASSCFSILVRTGVYTKPGDDGTYDSTNAISNQNHRDFVIDPDLKNASFIVENVLEAVDLVFKEEDFL